MTLFFYGIPFLGALIGFLSVYLVEKIFLHKMHLIPFVFNKFFKINFYKKTVMDQFLKVVQTNLSRSNDLKKILIKSDKKEIEKHVEPFLERIILSLRNQIPMGTMLISEALKIKIKELSLIEIQNVIPEITKRFLGSLNSINLFQGLSNFEWEEDLKKPAQKLIKKLFFWVKIFAMVLGFLIGTLFLVLGYLFSYH